MDGRVAFTCVNTTQWSVINGTLYMNSCGMYSDFVKNPQADIGTAEALWRKWWGELEGPVNDACFQDGGRWGGPPNWVAALYPERCVIN